MIQPAVNPDRDLVLKVASGDPDAARDLLDTTGAPLYGFVYARVGGNQTVAEDIVQSTYLEAMKAADTYRGDSSVTTWLFAIARRQVFRHYESERRRELLQSKLRLVHDDTGAMPEGAAITDEDEMIRALGKLSPLHRQVLVLKYLDHLSVADISSEIGKSEVQVQSLLQRARKGLKAALEGGSHE